jgi:hypothetical protein
MMEFSEFAASIGLSELQLSLGLIGFGLLIVVMIYNAFRLRKVELSNSDSSSTINHEAPNSYGKTEPSLALNHATKAELPTIHRIDSLTDCVIALRLPEPISGQEITDHLNLWPKNSMYPWMCEGLISQTVGTEPLWEPIKVDGQYLELQTAIQLANRQGAIGVVDLSDFMSRSQALANTLDAEIDLPPVNDTLQEAQQLDQFAAPCDIQLGVTIIPKNNMWNLAEIKNAAAKAGFLMSRDGRQFHRVLDNLVAYSLVADESNFLRGDLAKADIRSVTLLLDLPKVPQSINPFRTMLNDAHLLADAINGNLVDDSGRPLIDDAIHAIESQVNAIYQAMFQHGISAGSPSAYRLFS